MVLQVALAVSALGLMLVGFHRWRDGGGTLMVAGGLMLIPQLRVLAEGLGFSIPPNLYIGMAVAAAIGVTARLVVSSARKPPEIWLLVAAMGVLILYLVAPPTSRLVEITMAAGLAALWSAFAVVALRRSLSIQRVPYPKG